MSSWISNNHNIVDIQSSDYSVNYEQYSLVSSISPLGLIGRRIENRLLNTQARIEYELLKARILDAVQETNKFLNIDDQIVKQEYKLCLSLCYRKQIFVMEFRQLPTDSRLYNHALDLVFQGSNRNSNTSGRTTLVLTKENAQFVWRQINANVGGPSGNSKVLASVILRWLQDESSLFMRFAP